MPGDVCLGAACDAVNQVVLHHHVAPTSFLRWSDFTPSFVPAIRSWVGGFRHFVGAEKAFFQWLHDRLFGPSYAQAGQSRIVEYLHAGSPEAKHLDAVWWEAVKQWYGQPSDISNSAVWQQRWCVKANGTPGPDAGECWKKGILGKDTKNFPVVRFFPAGSPSGQDFDGEQTPAQLVHFAKTLNKLDQDEREAATEGQDVGFQVAEYYAGGCPHCQRMKPAWEEAVTKWGEETEAHDRPLVMWKAKECFDGNWHPGRDYSDCMKQNVRSFPTVRFSKFSVDGVEEATDYTGPRNAEGFLHFVRENIGVDTSADSTAQNATAATAGGAEGSTFKVGELVEALYQGKAWINARIAKVNDDGSYIVSWIDGDANDTHKSAAELHRPELQGDDYENEVAKAGFDYNLVNYYAAGGARSKRLGGLYAKAMQKWSDMTDPSDDAMFIAGLKQADARRGIDPGMTERTDPPFVWFEQRECYDKNWHPGRDYEFCRKHGVHELPSIRLYPFDEKTGHFSKEGVEFHGPRTIKGIVDFLSKETDWPTIKENIKRYEQVILGSEGADRPPTEKPVVSRLPVAVGTAGATAAAADHGTVGADGDDFFGYVRSKMRSFMGAAPPPDTGDISAASSAAAVVEKAAAMPWPLAVVAPPPVRRARPSNHRLSALSASRCGRHAGRASMWASRGPVAATFL